MKRTRKLLLMIVLVLVMLLGLTSVTGAITNGKLDGTNHPYVVLVVFDDAPGHPAWRCSGSLLSSTLVLTAGHCTDGAVAARVWTNSGDIRAYDTNYPNGGPLSYEGVPFTNPGYGTKYLNSNGLPGYSYHDVGVVVLSEPVPTSVVPASSYAQLPSAGQVDTLKNKTPIDFVGYGVQYQMLDKVSPDFGNRGWFGPIVRMYAPGELVSGKFVNSAEYMRLSLNPGGGSGGTCFGDSGGPDLLGGTSTVLAVNSYVTNYNCSGVGYSQRIDIPDVLAWITGSH